MRRVGFKQTFEKIKIKYKRAYEKQKVITLSISILVGLVGLVFVLDLAVAIIKILNIAIVHAFHFISMVGGSEDTFNVWLDAYQTDDQIVLFESTMDLYLGFFSIIRKTTDAFIQILVVQFPVIEDLKFDLNWLLVDFARIIKTAFNLIQFLLIFILIRKTKQKIRRKFTKKETDWSAIKCF